MIMSSSTKQVKHRGMRVNEKKTTLTIVNYYSNNFYKFENLLQLQYAIVSVKLPDTKWLYISASVP